MPGFISHVELQWEWPALADFLHRLGGTCRVVTFDKRGTGLSDRPGRLPDLDQRMLDVLAVMDATGVEQAALVGLSEGGPMAAVFAASHPDRTKALVLVGSYASLVRSTDHPLGFTEEEIDATADRLAAAWGTGVTLGGFAPSLADDPVERRRWGRMQRMAASPNGARDLVSSLIKLDARPALPLVQAPTLVVHRQGDRIAPIELGRELADLIQESPRPSASCPR